MLSRALIIILIASPLIAFSKDYKYYYSPNKLFSVRIPANFRVCREIPQAPNNGVRILVDDTDCNPFARNSQIEVSGIWNVPYYPEVKGAKSYAELKCKDNPVTRANFRFAGLDVYGCATPLEGDFFRIVYYASRDFVVDEPDMIYVMGISCRTSIRDKCLSTFEKIIETATLNTD